MQALDNLYQPNRPSMSAEDAVKERLSFNSPLGKVQSSFALNATIDRTEARSVGGDSADLSSEPRCQSIGEIQILHETTFRTSWSRNKKKEKGRELVK